MWRGPFRLSTRRALRDAGRYRAGSGGAIGFRGKDMNTVTRTFALGWLLVAIPALASAQMVEKVDKRVLTLSGARTIAAAAEAEATRLKTTGAIAIVDD